MKKQISVKSILIIFFMLIVISQIFCWWRSLDLEISHKERSKEKAEITSATFFDDYHSTVVFPKYKVETMHVDNREYDVFISEKGAIFAIRIDKDK